jgi:glycosyltransferase involved in cell wall biosynthesis
VAFDRSLHEGAGIHIGQLAAELFDHAGSGLLIVLAAPGMPLHQNGGDIRIHRLPATTANHGHDGTGRFDVDGDVVYLSPHEQARRRHRQAGGLRYVVPLGDEPEHALRRLATDLDGGTYSHGVACGGAWPVAAAPVLAAWLAHPWSPCCAATTLDTAVLSPRRRFALAEALRASARVGVVASRHRRLVHALIPGAQVTWVANGIDTTGWTVLPPERRAAQAWRSARVSRARGSLLASDAGGLADLVDDGIGFTLAAGDTAGCRAAVNRFLAADEELLAELGTAGAELVRRDLSPAVEAAGYLAVRQETLTQQILTQQTGRRDTAPSAASPT